MTKKLCEKCGKENILKHSVWCPECEPKGLVHEFMMSVPDDYEEDDCPYDTDEASKEGY